MKILQLRTKRLTLDMGPISIAQAIKIGSMPDALEQSECTLFLRYAVKNVENGDKDPQNWTVQERILAVCHYLSATDSDPDFPVGDLKYSDYLDHEVDIDPSVQSVSVESVGGDTLSVQHLTGRMAEAIERLAPSFLGAQEYEGITPYTYWLTAAMAAQIVVNQDTGPDENGPYEHWLLHKIKTFFAYPEQEFTELLTVYHDGKNRLYHLFNIDFSTDGGIVALPKAAGGAGLKPASFPARACLSETALALAGKSA